MPEAEPSDRSGSGKDQGRTAATSSPKGKLSRNFTKHKAKARSGKSGPLRSQRIGAKSPFVSESPSALESRPLPFTGQSLLRPSPSGRTGPGPGWPVLSGGTECSDKGLFLSDGTECSDKGLFLSDGVKYPDRDLSQPGRPPTGAFPTPIQPSSFSPAAASSRTACRSASEGTKTARTSPSTFMFRLLARAEIMGTPSPLQP